MCGALCPEAVAVVGLGLYLLAVLLCLVRLWLGPSAANRVMMMDLLTSLALGIIAAAAVLRDLPIYLEVAVGVALVAFLASLAFSLLIRRGA